MSRATVALVGRPNTGKSTLFNRLVGGREAIVSDKAGTTRDRHFGEANWIGVDFWLVDTGGLVPGSQDTMDKLLDFAQTMSTDAGWQKPEVFLKLHMKDGSTFETIRIKEVDFNDEMMTLDFPMPYNAKLEQLVIPRAAGIIDAVKRSLYRA